MKVVTQGSHLKTLNISEGRQPPVRMTGGFYGSLAQCDAFTEENDDKERKLTNKKVGVCVLGILACVSTETRWWQRSQQHRGQCYIEIDRDDRRWRRLKAATHGRIIFYVFILMCEMGFVLLLFIIIFFLLSREWVLPLRSVWLCVTFVRLNADNIHV